MRKRDAIAWAALCAAPLIALAVALSVLPDTIALHSGPDGKPDRWGSKYECCPQRPSSQPST